MKENLEKRERENAADKLLNFRPVFFVAVFLCLGIAFSYVCTFNGVSPWWGVLVLPLIGALVLLCDVTSAKKTALTVSALLVAFLCGFTSFHARTENYLQKTVMDGEYAVCGVVEYKRENEFGLELILSSVTVAENEQEGKLIAYLPSSFSENVRLADKVLLEGRVMENREFSAYSADENIRFTMYADGMTVVGKEFRLFLLIRDRLESVIYENMEESAAALTVAVLTGNTDGISDGLLSNMRYGGIAHIFAVSGLHVSALYGFCSMLINKTKLRKLPKLARFFLTATLLLGYGGVCGFSASIIRATVICLVLLAAKLIGIASDMTENVGAAAIVVLVRSPFALLTVGFQLSFAAFLGIAWLTRPITNGCYFLLERVFPSSKKSQSEERPLSIQERMIRAVVSFLAVSLSAQIFTAPILLSAFGYLSGWALLLNGIFVPVLSTCFSALLALALLSCLLPFLAGILLYLPALLWTILTLLFEIVDFSKFCITDVKIAGGAFVLYYLTLSFLTDKWNLKPFLKKLFLAVGFLLFGIGMYALNV